MASFARAGPGGFTATITHDANKGAATNGDVSYDLLSTA